MEGLLDQPLKAKSRQVGKTLSRLRHQTRPKLNAVSLRNQTLNHSRIDDYQHSLSIDEPSRGASHLATIEPLTYLDSFEPSDDNVQSKAFLPHMRRLTGSHLPHSHSLHSKKQSESITNPYRQSVKNLVLESPSPSRKTRNPSMPNQKSILPSLKMGAVAYRDPNYGDSELVSSNRFSLVSKQQQKVQQRVRQQSTGKQQDRLLLLSQILRDNKISHLSNLHLPSTDIDATTNLVSPSISAKQRLLMMRKNSLFEASTISDL
jgi:hypothetical protein